MTVTHDESAVR